METIIRADAAHPDFLLLVKELNAFLSEIDGEEFDFYFQFNQLDSIRHTLILYLDDTPVACGAIKPYEPGTMEIKRMFTRPEYRNQGVGKKVLNEIEAWARSEGFTESILETGIRQPEAIAAYEKSGYARIPNFPPYENVIESICYTKKL
ncbi:MAG: GNAT family N-acetyltransferase [Chitinophagaceae bacterium]|nr:GNAT family N-acetyltransferase [Chitinophagaceae bacterium]